MVKPALPPILSSYRVHAGQVDEVTWTPEDKVIVYLLPRGSELDHLTLRYWLRDAVGQGILTGRQNPEHAFWEYGSQWRAKGFLTVLDAVQAAAILVGRYPGQGRTDAT